MQFVHTLLILCKVREVCKAVDKFVYCHQWVINEVVILLDSDVVGST